MLKLLKNARDGGLENFVIVSNGENLDQIKEVCQDVDFIHNVEIVIQKDLSEGMAGGISAGLEKVADEESVFIMGGNDYVESSLLFVFCTVTSNHRSKNFFHANFFLYPFAVFSQIFEREMFPVLVIVEDFIYHNSSCCFRCSREK